MLSGNLDPVIVIYNTQGDRLAQSNTAGPNQPEVIGQFVFPVDGYYELGITGGDGEGEVGVSVYRLDPADVEGGGTFEAIDQTLHGVIDHPSTYHTFRLPVQRGQRFDLGAEALTEGLTSSTSFTTRPARWSPRETTMWTPTPGCGTTCRTSPAYTRLC